jgi:hypothetical protein
MRFISASAFILLAGAAGFAQDRPAASPIPVAFGDARLSVPAGWKQVHTRAGANNVGVLLLAPPHNTDRSNLTILVSPGQDLRGAAFPKVFDAVLKSALPPDEHLVQYSELPLRQAAGYAFATRSMIVADAAGHRSVRICFGANPGHRLEMLIVSADSQETLHRYQSDVASVLNSYSFEVGSDSTSLQRAAPPTTDGHPPIEGSNAPNTVPVGTRTSIPEGGSVLLCTDPARLDGAMDFAKYGDSYNALRAVRNDAFFHVNGPVSLEVRQSELKSRWPKVFVEVLDGDSAGRTGWAVLSELKDLTTK